MFKIAEKYPLNTSKTIFRVSIEAPLIAKSAQPGQFAIFRLDEFGERFPLTIADYDPEVGTVSFNFQPAGKSTQMFSLMEPGDYIADIVGPLGRPAEIDPNAKRVCVVGGGTGCAINYPVAKELKRLGIGVDMICGFRSKDIVIMEDEFRAACDNLYICTDDGSYGEAGFVTNKLKALLESGVQYDSVLTCGPVVMMKYVAEVTRPYGLKTNASLNPIMIDGTGMCGGCRLTVGGERKFACVDGPEFDAHLVDWDSLLERNNFYLDEEGDQNEHICRITGGVRRGEYKPSAPETEPDPAKRMTKHPMPEQDPVVRAKNFNEVALGYAASVAQREAQRCLTCKNPQCVKGCPVNVRIPEFIAKVKEGDFEGGYEVIATLLYNQMLGGIPDFNRGAVIAMIMLIPSIGSICILQLLERFNIRYTRISQADLRKNPLRDTGWGISSTVISVAILSIFAVIFVVPLVEEWPYQTGFSLEHFAAVFTDSELITVYWHSLVMALLTALLGTLAAYGAALITARSTLSPRYKRVIESIALVTNAIPGMVLGVAYMFLFSGTSLQNTLLLMILCNIVHYFSTPYLMMKNSLSKMNAGWETTAMLMGDSWLQTILRVVTPNTLSSLIEVFSYYFINSMVTISALIFIAGARTMVLTTMIKQLQYVNRFNEVFVLSLLILATNLIAKGLFSCLASYKAAHPVKERRPIQLFAKRKEAVQ